VQNLIAKKQRQRKNNIDQHTIALSLLKKLPAATAYKPINLLLYFFETIRGAAINVPKTTLII